MELDGQLIEPRLFKMVLGFFRVIGALRQLVGCCTVNIGRTNGVIVAQFTITKDNLLQPIFPVNDMFYRVSDVSIVKRSHGGDHRQGDLLVTCGGPYRHFRIPFEQIDRFQIRIGDGINSAGHQRACPCRRIANLDGFALIKMRGSIFPIIRISLGQGPDAWIMFGNHIASGAHTRLPINCPVTV